MATAVAVFIQLLTRQTGPAVVLGAAILFVVAQVALHYVLGQVED